MSRDPYHDVKREVESSLSQTQSLLSSYLRLLPSVSSSSRSPLSPTPNQRHLIDEAHEELLGMLGNLMTDLEDLEDSVLAVEESGEMFGMDDREVRERRSFLEGVKLEMERIRQRASPPSSSDPFQDIPIPSSPHSSSYSARAGPGPSTLSFPRSNPTPPPHSTPRHPPRPTDSPDSPNAYKRSSEPDLYEQEQQQMIMRQQDNALDVIGGTLRGLGEMAGLIGREVGEQNVMLDDLSTRVDDTDSRLTRANKKLKRFIRKNEESKSGWCIAILIVVLMILLLLVIIT